ncbi:MAG: hypothetical protein PHN32_07735 [Actinomycetota bacterium]|nr:hypothetical protein [Actinomycetota bacterium]
MIPLTLNLKIKRSGSRRFHLWLPLFILWLIILPLLMLPAPLVFLAALIAWPSGKGGIILHSYLTIFNLIFNSSGTRLHIKSPDREVFVNLV